MLRLEPVLARLEHCLATVPWEPLEFRTNFSEIIEIQQNRDWNCLRNFCPNPATDIYF